MALVTVTQHHHHHHNHNHHMLTPQSDALTQFAPHSHDFPAIITNQPQPTTSAMLHLNIIASTIASVASNSADNLDQFSSLNSQSSASSMSPRPPSSISPMPPAGHLIKGGGGDFTRGSQASISCSPKSPVDSSCSEQCHHSLNAHQSVPQTSSFLSNNIDTHDQHHLHPEHLLRAPLNHHRRPNGHHNRQQQQQLQQLHYPNLKARSLSDSVSDQQSASTCAIQPVRRLSRNENRHLLSDLGYGKIESYFKLQRLGKGTYATVYMGRSRLSNDLVALKEILKEHDEGAPCTAIREVSLLRLLRHNNIVTLHDICHTPRKLTLVFEYVGPDMYAYMKENNQLLSVHNIRLLLFQLLRGISFCHSRQVLHRDLKPQNLLINSCGELKICDFGLARAKSIPTKSYSNEVVTLWYRPPDVLLGNTDYDHSIDMWGVGCIFYEMISGRTLFPGSSVRQQLYLIFSTLGAPNKQTWPDILTNEEYLSYNFPLFRPEKLCHRAPRLDEVGMDLLMSFLRYKPSSRISAEVAKRHPFFSSLPEELYHLNERGSIFDVPGVAMTQNPGLKLNHM